MASDRFLTTDEAATYLGFSKGTLSNWRIQRKGPPYSRSQGAGGAVRYRLSDLDAWMSARRAEA